MGEKQPSTCKGNCSIADAIAAIDYGTQDYDADNSMEAAIMLSDVAHLKRLYDGLPKGDCEGSFINPQTGQKHCPKAESLNTALTITSPNGHALLQDGSNHSTETYMRGARAAGEIQGMQQATQQYFGKIAMEKTTKRLNDAAAEEKKIAEAANDKKSNHPGTGQYL